MTGRRIAIALLVVGVLGMAAVGASWLAVKIWGPAFTADRIAAAITEASGRPARVESVLLEPLRGRVRVSGLTVGAADDGAGQPMVRVGRIDVAIRLESFWRRELVIGIAAQTAQVQLKPEPGSTRPFTFDMPERFQLGPISARLSSIRLDRSRLRYEDEASGFTLVLDGLAATGRPQGGGLELTASVDTVNFRVGGVTEKLERLVIEGRIDATKVLVRRLEAGGDDRTLKVSGAIESPWTQPVLAAEATVRLGLGPITRNLGSAVAVEGTAAIDLTLGGPLASPVVSGRLHLERLDVADVSARDLVDLLYL